MLTVFTTPSQGEDPSAGNPNFWSEVLLLKVNIPFLERCVILTAEDQLVTLQVLLQMLVLIPQLTAMLIAYLG